MHPEVEKQINDSVGKQINILDAGGEHVIHKDEESLVMNFNTSVTPPTLYKCTFVRHNPSMVST